MTIKYVVNHPIPKPLTKHDWVGIDTEIFDAKQSQLHLGKYGKLAVGIISYEDNRSYLYTRADLFADVLKQCWQATWVFHKAAFDVPHIRCKVWNFPDKKKFWDTMLIERIMFSGYYPSYALMDLSRRWLHREMAKGERKQFYEEKEITQEMLYYSAMDGIITRLVALAQHRECKNNPKYNYALKVWKQFEKPVFWAVQGFKPTPFDIDQWRENTDKALRIISPIKEKYKGVNLNAPAQVKKLLAKQGLNLTSTGKAILQSYEGEYEVVRDLLQYRKYAKKAQTYGHDWIRKYVEIDNEGLASVVSAYKQIGTVTSRFSSHDPNMQNIPSEYEYRKCVIARPGYKIVVADYSQQEPRAVSILSGDRLLQDEFHSGNDIYLQMVKRIYGKEVEKSDPLRQTAKSLLLGLTYGMSKYGLAARLEVDVDEAAGIMKKFFAAYPMLGAWLEERERKPMDEVITLGEHHVHLNPYVKFGKIVRQNKNYPVQGTAAEISKLAGIGLYQAGYNILEFIHDEYVLHVPEEGLEESVEEINQIMEDAGSKILPNMPMKVGIGVGDTWAVDHH